MRPQLLAPRLLAVLLAVAALGAGAVLAAPAAAGQSVTWDVHWDNNNPGAAYTSSPSFSGRAAYLDSGYGVTATIAFSGNVPGQCIGAATFTLTHTGNSATGLSNAGVFNGINPGVICNGTYKANLSARNPVAAGPSSALQPFTYQHPSTGVAKPALAQGSDGTSLVVSWAPPPGATPDLVGYQVTRTYQPAAGGPPQVANIAINDPGTTSYAEEVGNDDGGYQFTVQARYWGVGGPGAAEVLSGASQPAQATVAAPQQQGGNATPGTAAGGAKPVINTAPGAASSFFPVPNVPHTDTPDPAVPGLPTLSTATTEALDPQGLDLPEPGGPVAVKPKTPLTASAMVDHPTRGGLNGRTIAIVAASVLVLGLIAAQLTFLSRRASELELVPEEVTED